MIRDNGKWLVAGFKSLPGGMDSGNAPSDLQPDQVAFAINTTFRDGQPQCRPPWNREELEFVSTTVEDNFNEGVFQDAIVYRAETGNDGFLVMAGGRLFRVQMTNSGNTVSDVTPQYNVVTTADVTFADGAVGINISVNSVNSLSAGQSIVIDGHSFIITTTAEDLIVVSHVSEGGGPYTIDSGAWINAVAGVGGIVETDVNPPNELFAHMIQAENYGLVFQGEKAPIVYDGSKSRRLDTANNELPAGYIAAYVNGRIWVVLNNRGMYVAGDLIGSSSGTKSKQYRDAILKMTENTYLNEGGAFVTPSDAGLITAIGTTTNLDTALAQGPVLIGCESAIFSCNAPVDRTIWKDITYPIQTIADTEYGPLSPRSFLSVNSDKWYRSQDGFRSFLIARRNFNSGWGNSSMSHEITRIVEQDTEHLLGWCSGVLFDNRMLQTVSPSIGDKGVVHAGLVSLCFDEVTSLRNRANPAWEGIWTGLNIHKVVKGKINGIERCFAFVQGADNSLELWELLKEGQGDTLIETIDGTPTAVVTPIQWSIETASWDFEKPFEPKLANTAKLWVNGLFGTVTFAAYLKPDQGPCWFPWHTWTECNKTDICDSDCMIWPDYKPGYRSPMLLPKAPDTCGDNNLRANIGNEFQVRLVITGKCKITKFMLNVNEQLSNTSGECR